MEIARIYEHKTFGRIGDVVLECPDFAMSLNGKDIPAGSIKAIMKHGLQILQDAYAGAKSKDEAEALWSKKLDKIVAGTLGERGVSDEMSDRDEVIARKWIAFKGMTFTKGTLLPEKLDCGLVAWEKDTTPAKELILKQAVKFVDDEKARKEREAAELRELTLAMAGMVEPGH